MWPIYMWWRIKSCVRSPLGEPAAAAAVELRKDLMIWNWVLRMAVMVLVQGLCEQRRGWLKPV